MLMYQLYVRGIMIKRHVRRRSARPIIDNSPVKGRVKRFFLSFTPRYFKEYWVSRAGLVRLGKLAGAGFVFMFLVFLWYAKDKRKPPNFTIQPATHYCMNFRVIRTAVR
jgi:hypothetical protein